MVTGWNDLRRRILAGLNRTAVLANHAEASISPNTRRAYSGALRRLDAWLDGAESVHLLFAGPPRLEAPDSWSREKVLDWARASLDWVEEGVYSRLQGLSRPRGGEGC